MMLLTWSLIVSAGMEIEKPHDGEDMSHQVDQPDDDQDVPYGPHQPLEEHVPYQSDQFSLREQHVPCQANQLMEE